MSSDAATTDLLYRPVTELASSVRAGELSARELVQTSLDRIEELEPKVNAFVDVFAEEALADADAIGADDPRPFAGVPIAIKNNRGIAGKRLTFAADFAGDFLAPQDHNIVRRLKDAGFVIVGSTALPEWGILPVSQARRFGPTNNPWDLTRTPGGSSGGSAAAVAAGQADFALGGDEAGSIRIPAAWCGVVGMKATHGLVPSYGLTYLDHTLDHIGPLTRTVERNAQVLGVLAGHDDRDPQWVRAKPQPADYLADLGAGLRGLRIGVVEQSLAPAGCIDETLAAFEQVRSRVVAQGGRTEAVSIPLWSAAWPIELVIIWFAGRAMLDSGGVGYGHLGAMNVHAAAALAAQLRTCPDDLALPTRLSLIAAEHARDQYLGVHYAKAHNLRRELRRQVEAALDGVDLLMTPTVPHVAVELRTGPSTIMDMVAVMADNAVANTCPLDLTGHPALTVPAGTAEHGLPFGVQLIGPAFAEPLLYRAGAALEAG